MPRPNLCFMFLLLAAAAVPGCGGSSGPAQPTAELSELEQYLADNPDADQDLEPEEDEGA